MFTLSLANLWLSALTPSALAACTVAQTHGADGIEFDISADGTCPAVSVVADRSAQITAWTVHEDFPKRLPKEQLVAHPWGVPALGWRLTAPTLLAGDHLLIRLAWTKDVPGEPHVDVLLDGSAPTLARGASVAQEWSYVANTHPEWGFTDPKFGRWQRSSVWTFGPDGEAGWLDGPSATGSWWSGGPGAATVRYEAAPAPAMGEVRLPPGSLNVTLPNGVLIGRSDEADVQAVPDGVRATAPAGGDFRWRVQSVSGIGVVADDVAFVAGTDARFGTASLPEPAVPMALRGNKDKDAVLHALWDAVRAPIRGVLGDVTHPRPLNRAWQSGWMTDGERALVLLRFLGQERVPARWVLTGEHADADTFVGYDRLLLAAQPGKGVVLWLDPACPSCGFGEIDPALSGKPALGGADHIPLLPGTLTLTASLGENGVDTVVVATGDGARWIRSRVRTAQRDSDLARIFGVVAPETVTVEGWDADIRVVFHSARPPRPVDLPQFGG